MLSLAVWQDTCLTYKNLEYDLAHYESHVAQWLERPTGIWKVMGSTPVGGSVFRLDSASPLFSVVLVVVIIDKLHTHHYAIIPRQPRWKPIFILAMLQQANALGVLVYQA